jgi:hypothetical protein
MLTNDTNAMSCQSPFNPFRMNLKSFYFDHSNFVI